MAASLAVQAHGQSVPTNGLVAYYPFNGNANDASGNGNNGTIHGALNTTNRFGTTSSALSFNGSNAYVDFGSPGLLAFPSNFTVSAWCSFIGGSANPRLIDYGQDYGFELLTAGTGAARRFQFACGYSTYIQTTASYPQNTWMQVVGVVSNGTAFLYVNAALGASGAI